MSSNSCHGNHTKDLLLTLSSSETLKDMSNTLLNLAFVQLSVHEMRRGGGGGGGWASCKICV